MTDEDFDELELERRSKAGVARHAVEQLSPSTGVALAEYALRMGLGTHFAKVGDDVVTRDVDPTPKDLGALLAIRFDTLEDPAHDDLLSTLTEWHREDHPDGDPDGYSIAWGSGAPGDVDDPPPARGARRCDECDEWTSEYADECSRCGGDPYADSRGDA